MKLNENKTYDERCLKRWEHAKEQIESMFSNYDLLGIFKQQLDCRENPIIDQVDEAIENLKSEKLTEENHKGFLALLQLAYTDCMVFICDSSCEHNPLPRRGQRKYTKPKKFYCDLITEQNTEQTKPPEWLDVEKNICSNYHVNLSK